MSRSRFRPRLLWAALLPAVLGAAPAPAQARTSSLPYTCQYPGAGIVPFKVAIASEAPLYVDPYGILPLDPFVVTVVATGENGAAPALPGVAKIVGSGQLEVAFDQGTSAGQPTAVPLAIEPYFPPAGLTVAGTGKTPEVPLGDEDVTVRALGLSFNLRALDGGGQPVAVPVPATDLDGNPAVDSDGDPTTFDVSCTPDPAQQDVAFAFIQADDLTIVETCWFVGQCPALQSPENLRLADRTTTTATLAWTRPDLRGFSSYDLFTYAIEVDGRQFAPETLDKSFTVDGLKPGTRYDATVRTTSPYSDERSEPATVSFTTEAAPAPTPLGYGAAGSATLRGLVTGQFPVSGEATVAVGTDGAVTGSLQLAPAGVNLKVLGFLPATAKLGFVNVGDATGTAEPDESLSGWPLTLRQKTRIQVRDVRLFGTLRLAGGTTCQTRQPSELVLSSSSFAPLNPGRLTGTFALSNLTGCGALTGLISPLTAGTNGVLVLGLEPKP